MRSRTRVWFIGTAIAGLLAPALVSVAASPAVAAAAQQVVARYDFEDGSAQGWTARGAATVAVATEAAHSGSHGLRTTGRTQGWEGPTVELTGTLTAGGTYGISAHVRLVPGQPAGTVQLTVQRTPADGGATAYDFVTNGTATDAGWAELSGEYTVPGEVSQLQLYVESSSATLAYDLDDLVITAKEPPGQAGVTSDFEDATTQGWHGRGGAEQTTVSTADAHGGTHSLLTTGRTQSWMGPSLNLVGKLAKGSRYTFSAWVKLAPGEPATDVRMSMERRTNGTASYDRVVGDSPATANGWTELRGTYTLAYDVDYLAVYLESTGTGSFLLDDFAMSYVAPLPIEKDIPSLKDVLAKDFPIGAAIGPAQITGVHAELLAKHFSSVTPGNSLKWDATEPAEGSFRWADSDAQVNFGVEHGTKVRGHTLVWHSQTPSWVFLDAAGAPMRPTAANKALLLRRIENHTRAVVGRYKGKIHSWDVMNEVVDEYAADGNRRSTWYEIAGLDYIRTAFRVAHEADPGAKLYINDYNTELPRKRAAMLALVRKLRAEGVPLDGVGHQLHVDIEKAPIAEIERSIAAVGALGLDNQVTELDVSAYTNITDTYTTVPPDVLAEQGYRYAQLFDAFRRQRAHLSSVTVWGLADDGTWLSAFPITRLNPPLFFDEQLQAKPAYWGVVDRAKLPAYTRTLTVPKGRPSAAEWSLLPATPVIAPSGRSLRFKLRWESRRLHLLAEVADRSANRGDAVEVTVAGKRYRIPRTGALPKGVKAKVDRTSSGYRIDASLPLPAGERVPFDVALIDPAETVHWGAGRAGELVLVDALRHYDARRGTPTIDGSTDRVWSRAKSVPLGVQVAGSGGASATAKVLWDSGHVYVLATVTDPTLDASSPNVWEHDSLEIFLDPDNAKTAGYTDDDGQYRVNFQNLRSMGGNFGGYGLGKLTSATRRMPGGYVVEASIELNTVRPRPGTLLGFDLQVNDATAGARTAARSWHDPTGLSYVNTSRWGVLRLVSG